MITRILPTDVRAVTFDDLAVDEATAWELLHPEEQKLVATASTKRRTEFAAARLCAHEALRQLNHPVVPILRGGRGMPLFPDGVVGTLTHCAGLRAAALAKASCIRSIGLDVEVHQQLPPGVLETIALEDEAQWVRAALASDASMPWDVLLFTAKEATYKAWFPLTRRWLGFEEARIEIAVAERGSGWGEGTFNSTILSDPHPIDGGLPLKRLTGRWVSWGSHVASAIVLDHEGDGAVTERGR